MKKLFVIFSFLLFGENVFAQNLYLLYNGEELGHHALQLKSSDISIDHLDDTTSDEDSYFYVYKYPEGVPSFGRFIFAGVPLRLLTVKKAVNTVTISPLTNLVNYDVKTIQQLMAILEPKTMEEQKNYFWERNLFVVEINQQAGTATIRKVEVWIDN